MAQKVDNGLILLISSSYKKTTIVNRVIQFFYERLMTVHELCRSEPVILHAMDFPDDFPDSTPALPVLTVSELNRMARRALE